MLQLFPQIFPPPNIVEQYNVYYHKGLKRKRIHFPHALQMHTHYSTAPGS